MAIDTRDKRFSAGSLLWLATLPDPDGTIDAPDRLQWLGLYRGIAASAIVYVLTGDIFSHVAANHGSGWVFHFEVFHRATTGTAYARLYNTTDSVAVANSAVNTASGTHVRQRSGAITLADGKEFRAQFGTVAGDAGGAIGAKIVLA